jgi:hypothetical protein
VRVGVGDLIATDDGGEIEKSASEQDWLSRKLMRIVAGFIKLHGESMIDAHD